MPPITAYQDPTHRQQVIDLWTATFGHSTGHNDPSLSIDKKLAVNDGLFFVAIVGGQIVGTTMAGYDGHRGWLYSVAVHPEYQASGIGTRLVRHAEDALTRLGCTKINLQILGSNQSVVAFYESMGYAVEDRISMGRKIANNIPGDP